MVEEVIQRGKTALVLEQDAFIKRAYRKDRLIKQILFHAVNPFFFGSGKAVRLLQPGHGAADALLVSQKFGIDAVGTNEPDDVGGNILIAHLRQRGIELPGGKAFPPQSKAQALEACAAEVGRTRTDDVQSLYGAALFSDETGKGFQVVAGAKVILTIAPRMAGERVRRIGKDHRAASRRAFRTLEKLE